MHPHVIFHPLLENIGSVLPNSDMCNQVASLHMQTTSDHIINFLNFVYS